MKAMLIMSTVLIMCMLAGCGKKPAATKAPATPDAAVAAPAVPATPAVPAKPTEKAPAPAETK